MSEKLSVVIPAFNEEKNIAKCIQELQATLREKHEIPYEIIVVNDNSQDGTESVVRAEMTTSMGRMLLITFHKKFWTGSCFGVGSCQTGGRP